MEMSIQDVLKTFSHAVICDGDYTTVLACNYEMAMDYSKYWEDSHVVRIGYIFNELNQYNHALNFQTVEDEGIEICDE